MTIGERGAFHLSSSTAGYWLQAIHIIFRSWDVWSSMLLARGIVSIAKMRARGVSLWRLIMSVFTLFEKTTYRAMGNVVMQSDDGKGGGQEHLSCCHGPF